MKIISGRKPVLEAINSGEDLEQVYILYGQRGGIIDAIRVAAKKRNIKCSEVSSEKFRQLTGEGDFNTQGVAARKTSYRFFGLNEIITEAKKETYPLVLLLDSIQDTHNLGAIIRSAECAGVKGIIITRHNSAPVNETVVKTSAGATEHMKICVVNNLVNTIKELKDEGFWIIGSALAGAVDYNTVDYKIPAAVVLGNEEKGIRRLTADSCDVLIKIPMKGKLDSLNVSVAAGVILFEIIRQRSL
jgi:23S rRNA (guanosine2251-2'-O)-methyltransferase